VRVRVRLGTQAVTLNKRAILFQIS
jgi:hypothetical protein